MAAPVPYEALLRMQRVITAASLETEPDSRDELIRDVAADLLGSSDPLQETTDVLAGLGMLYERLFRKEATEQGVDPAVIRSVAAILTT